MSSPLSPRVIQPLSVPSRDMYVAGSRPAAEGEQIQPQNTDLFQAVVESRECEGFFKGNFVGQGVASKRLEYTKLNQNFSELKEFCEFVEAKFKGVDSNQQDFLKTVLAQGDGARRADFNRLVDQVDPDLPRLHADLNKINWGEVGVFVLGFALFGAGLSLPGIVSSWCLLMVPGGMFVMFASAGVSVYRFNRALKGKEGLIDKAWGHFIKTLHQPLEGEGVNVGPDNKDLIKQLNCFFELSCQFSRYRDQDGYDVVKSKHYHDLPSSKAVRTCEWVPVTAFILFLTQYAQEFRAQRQGNTNGETA